MLVQTEECRDELEAVRSAYPNSDLGPRIEAALLSKRGVSKSAACVKMMWLAVAYAAVACDHGFAASPPAALILEDIHAIQGRLPVPDNITVVG